MTVLSRDNNLLNNESPYKNFNSTNVLTRGLKFPKDAAVYHKQYTFALSL